MESPELTATRRQVLIGAAGLATFAISPASAQTGGIIARTEAGRVRGRLIDGIGIFQGIPYGAPTQGRRFLPANPPRKWTGVRDALDFGDEAPQPRIVWPGGESWANPHDRSENCLVLNVYTPGLERDRKRSVMVFLHGGGFFIGSADTKQYDGTRLARRGDVVVVTINHRLNAFGYLYLGHLAEDLADSGNVGNLDIVLALRWVQKNISQFGGDPGNVTIFGQSGGAGKVACLMAMPAATGLFHKAICQSGADFRMLSSAEAEENTSKLLGKMGLSRRDVDKLRAMPMTALETAWSTSGVDLKPVVDGRALPYHPFEPGAPACSRDVPLLVGTNTDETTRLVTEPHLFDLTWDDLPARLASDFPHRNLPQIIAAYRESEPFSSPSDVYFRATSDRRFRRFAIWQAERKAAQAVRGGASAFMYLVTWRTPVNEGKWRSPHSIELPFVFDNVEVSASILGEGREANPDVRLMAEAMSSTWIKFARTGNPGWGPYSAERRTTMVFDVPAHVEEDPYGAQRIVAEAD